MPSQLFSSPYSRTQRRETRIDFTYVLSTFNQPLLSWGSSRCQVNHGWHFDQTSPAIFISWWRCTPFPHGYYFQSSKLSYGHHRHFGCPRIWEVFSASLRFQNIWTSIANSATFGATTTRVPLQRWNMRSAYQQRPSHPAISEELELRLVPWSDHIFYNSFCWTLLCSLLQSSPKRCRLLPIISFPMYGANYNSPGLSESRTTDLFRYSLGNHTPSPLGNFSQLLVDHSPSIQHEQSSISPQSYFPFNPSASLSEPTYKSSPPQTDHSSAEALSWKSFADHVSSQPVQPWIPPFYTYTNPVPDLTQNEAQSPRVQPEQPHPESQLSNSPPAELVQTSSSPLNSLASSPQSQSINSLAASPVPEVSCGQVHTTTILDVCRKVGSTEDLIQHAIRKTEHKKQTNGGILAGYWITLQWQRFWPLWAINLMLWIPLGKWCTNAMGQLW